MIKTKTKDRFMNSSLYMIPLLPAKHTVNELHQPSASYRYKT